MTDADVAAAADWMLRRVQRDGALYQDQAAGVLQKKYGESAVGMNANGNLSIQRAVLAEFRKLTEATVVWDRSERAWRTRKKTDGPGRLADR